MTYLGYIRNHIKADIGRVKLSRLRPEDLDAWYLRLRGNGLATASVRKCHVIVNGALSQGHRWGWVTTNVAQLVSPPSVPSGWCAPPTPNRSAGCWRPRRCPIRSSASNLARSKPAGPDDGKGTSAVPRWAGERVGIRTR